MSDWYRDFANSGVGSTLVGQLGLPRPAVLRRYEPGAPLLPGPAVVGTAGAGRLRETLTRVLEDAEGTLLSGLDDDGGRLGAVLLDATGLSSPADLAAAHAFLAPAVKRLRSSGRVLVLGEPDRHAEPRGDAVGGRAAAPAAGQQRRGEAEGR